MNDNVILLGAGASVDAGIPLMSNFVETMLRMARLKRWNAGNFTPDDQAVLDEAVRIRNELDGFHGRAAIDVWNIEELLSVLMFHNADLVQPMSKAITRVIELSCKLTAKDEPNHEEGVKERYRRFWQRLIAWAGSKNRPIPVIVTFNYDLVLERSLVHLLRRFSGTVKEALRGYSGLRIAYHTSARDDVHFTFSWGENGLLNLHWIESLPANVRVLEVSILKLHGSLNFPMQREGENLQHFSFVSPCQSPLILPPVFNKDTRNLGSVWESAKSAIGCCSNLVVCGYSLPPTDTYMQYFFRAAIGANAHFNRIFVFDPAFHRPDHAKYAEELRHRYSAVFSDQMRDRINFGPVLSGSNAPRGRDGDKLEHGTFNDLVSVMGGMIDEVPFA